MLIMEAMCAIRKVVRGCLYLSQMGSGWCFILVKMYQLIKCDSEL